MHFNRDCVFCWVLFVGWLHPFACSAFRLATSGSGLSEIGPNPLSRCACKCLPFCSTPRMALIEAMRTAQTTMTTKNSATQTSNNKQQQQQKSRATAAAEAGTNCMEHASNKSNIYCLQPVSYANSTQHRTGFFRKKYWRGIRWHTLAPSCTPCANVGDATRKSLPPKWLQNVVFPSLRDSQAQHPGFAALPVLTSRLFWKEKVTHRTTMQHTTQKPTAATTVVEGQERPHWCRGLWFVTSLLALGLFGVGGLVGLTVSCLVFVFELRWGTRLGEAPHPLKSP